MPGQGRIVQRAYTPEERAALAGRHAHTGRNHLRHLPKQTRILAQHPAGVWTYKLGGYQVLKKWLSYRERTILRRPSSPTKSSTSPKQPAGSPRYCC